MPASAHGSTPLIEIPATPTRRLVSLELPADFVAPRPRDSPSPQPDSETPSAEAPPAPPEPPSESAEGLDRGHGAMVAVLVALLCTMTLLRAPPSWLLLASLAVLALVIWRERALARRRSAARDQSLAEAQARLASAMERFDTAGRGAQDGLWDWNLSSGRFTFSARWCEILGVAGGPGSLSPTLQAWFGRAHPEDLPRLRRALGAFMASEDEVFESQHRLRHTDGGWRWIRARAVAVRDEDGRVRRIAGSLGDVSDRKRYEDQLVHDAFHDPLTGLPNRSLFLNRVAHCIARQLRPGGPPFAVLFLDLDRFKVVNDSLGHRVGDLLLCSVAQRLERCLRPGDTVARLGGDEFTVLLEQLQSETSAVEVAARIGESLERPFELEGQQIVVSASIGIAPSTSGYLRPEELIRDADTAMYRAKADGRSAFRVFDPAMRERAVRRLQLESDLRGAIANEEFEVFYQPTIDLHSGAIRGFEALVRWRKDGELVSPGEFIPLAEETGLIVEIDGYVLRESCRQVAEWLERRGDEELALNVNVSGRQFRQGDVAGRVRRVLEETGLPARVLRLEITEGVVMEDPERSQALLSSLRELGVRVAIDDFGTGYSSLAYLRQFDLDDLKVDRSFVIGMGGERDTTAIVETVVALGHGLGLTVTAEGVETEEQLAQVRALGCEIAQGYLFSRPVPPDAAWDLLLLDPRW